MKPAEEVNSNSSSISSTLFTNFEGKFSARLSAVIPIHITNTTENAPISAKYDCRIKAAYHKEQSVGDWDTDDKSTMMIQISAIPINYDLVVRDNRKYEYVKGFSYPLIDD